MDYKIRKETLVKYVAYDPNTGGYMNNEFKAVGFHQGMYISNSLADIKAMMEGTEFTEIKKVKLVEID